MALVVPEEKQKSEEKNMENTDNMKECRICLELDTIDNLIWPCKCNGSIKYVHEKCLIKWIETTTNKEYKKKCSMCKDFYFIKKINKKEKIIFKIVTDMTNMFLEFLLIEILVSVLACTVAAIDTSYDSYSTRFLSLDLYKTDKLDNTLDSLFNVTYIDNNNFGREIGVLFYYNYAHYIFYLVTYAIFSIYIFVNLKNKFIYLNIMKLKYLIYFFYYNVFLIFFNVIMWNDSYNSALFFNVFMTIISYLNYFIFKTLLILHNDTITRINEKYFKMTILSVEPNPLLMI